MKGSKKKNTLITSAPANPAPPTYTNIYTYICTYNYTILKYRKKKNIYIYQVLPEQKLKCTEPAGVRGRFSFIFFQFSVTCITATCMKI